VVLTAVTCSRVGAVTQAQSGEFSGSASNSAGVVRSAAAIFRKLSRATLRSPRSTEPMKVRCNPHFSANAAWVRFWACRRSRTRNPTFSKNCRSSLFMVDNQRDDLHDAFE